MCRFRAALLLLLALVAAGCGNNPYPPGESAGNVRYALWNQEIRTMDPTVSYSVVEGGVIDNIYECFYKYDHLKESPYVLDLALGAAEPTRDVVTVTETDAKTGRPATRRGERWTFRIKKGLRFQDDPCFPGGKGREITAADFAFSWRRMADTHLNCPILSFVQSKVLGLDALVRHNTALSKQKKPADPAFAFPGVAVDPADPYALRITLVEPYPQLRYLMAMHFTSPIPHEAVEKYGDEMARHTVGCGTFLMAEYLPKQRITLVKNPNRMPETYPTTGDPGDREAGFLKDAGKPLPLVDKIVFIWTKESVTAWNLFQQGYTDAVGVSQENYNQVLLRPGRLTPERQKEGVRLQTSEVPATWYFAFNMKDPVWGGYNDRGRMLRRAVSLCIDREQWIDVNQQGYGKPAEFMLPPGIFGFEKSYRNPYSRHDVAEAKRLIALAGYPNGIDPRTGDRLTLNIDFIEGGITEQQAARILKQWVEAAGIRADIHIWQQVAWEERVLAGHATFFRYSWFADYPDPENFLQLLYGPNTGGVNYAAYNNPEYNRLYEQMRVMDDSPARLAIIRRMRTILQEDCPWINFYHPEGISISYPWVHNDKPHGIANDGLRYSGIDGAQRAAFQASHNQPRYGPIVVFIGLLVAAAFPAAMTVRARRNRSVRRHIASVTVQETPGDGI